MILLLGGSPRVGKSIIGRRLAETMGFEYVSTDDVDAKAAAAVTEEQRAILFPCPNFDGDAEKNVISAEERARLQMMTNQTLRPDIDAIVRSAIAENKNLVIEGARLLAEHVRMLELEFGAERIRSLFIGWKDIDGIVNGIFQDMGDRNWMKDGSPAVVRQVADFVAAYSARLESDAKQYGVTYRERTTDFVADTQFALEYFTR